MKNLLMVMLFLIASLAVSTANAAPTTSPFYAMLSASPTWRQQVVEKAQKIAAIKISVYQGSTDPNDLKQIKLATTILQFSPNNAIQNNVTNVLINYMTNANVLTSLDDYSNCLTQAENYIDTYFLLLAQTVYP
jgi:hypothetical protein